MSIHASRNYLTDQKLLGLKTVFTSVATHSSSSVSGGGGNLQWLMGAANVALLFGGCQSRLWVNRLWSSLGSSRDNVSGRGTLNQRVFGA